MMGLFRCNFDQVGPSYFQRGGLVVEAPAHLNLNSVKNWASLPAVFFRCQRELFSRMPLHNVKWPCTAQFLLAIPLRNCVSWQSDFCRQLRLRFLRLDDYRVCIRPDAPPWICKSQ